MHVIAEEGPPMNSESPGQEQSWFIRETARYEDMSPDGYLKVTQCRDGDIIVGVYRKATDEYDERPCGVHVEFCTVGGGGGHCPNTRRALVALMDAIDKDNKEDPRRKPPWVKP